MTSLRVDLRAVQEDSRTGEEDARDGLRRVTHTYQAVGKKARARSFAAYQMGRRGYTGKAPSITWNNLLSVPERVLLHVQCPR